MSDDLIGGGTAFAVHVALLGVALVGILAGLGLAYPVVAVVGAMVLSLAGVAAVVAGRSVLMPKGWRDVESGSDASRWIARGMGVALSGLGLALALALVRYAF